MAFGIFRNRNTTQGSPNVITAPAVPLTKTLEKDLDELTKRTRLAGAEIPTAIYSKIRVIDDILRSLLKFIDAQGCSVEQEYTLKTLITDHIPTALNNYLNLAEQDKGDTTAAALSLMRQYDTLEDKARALAEGVRSGAIQELSTHAHFIDAKFGTEN